MLSIIICSKNPSVSQELEKNIRETTGIDYEIITIDNSRNEYSIFLAYNTGILKSKYPYLCFVHEDVLFRSENWGKMVCRHLSDENTGVIGIAGGDLMTKVPAPWSMAGVARNFIQSGKSKKRKMISEFAHAFKGSEKQEVVLLDGVFLCMRRNIFVKIMFDDKTFNGFHAYDCDICIQSKLAGYKNYVVNNIVLEHFSHGTRNREWVINMLQVFKKWQSFLPVTLNNYSGEEIQKLEKKNLYLFIKRMIHTGFTQNEILVSTTEFWKEVFPERPVSDLECHLRIMRILKFFKILGLKTHF
jgi:hypothetical protein